MAPPAMDHVFGALAHASRRRILDIVKKKPGSTVGEIARRFRTSRIAVMKHLRVLEEADLLVSRKEGRARRHWVNVAPIQMIYDRWTTEWSALWGAQLTGVKYRVEGRGRRKGKGR